MDPDSSDVTYSNVGAGDSTSSQPLAAAHHTSPTEEIQLIRRMAAGDENALGELYDRWRTVVYALALRIVADARDAEEVLEDTFWQAWRQAPRYDASRGSVGTWLVTMARSRALDRARAHRRKPEAAEESEVSDVDSRTDTAGEMERAEESRIVRGALAELPHEQRQALELAYFEGLSQSEIAQRIGEPLGTIKTRMRLALRKLRDRLSVLSEQPLAGGGRGAR
jgi:RNA polymerase sigma-70 factor (ECF subfamily)